MGVSSKSIGNSVVGLLGFRVVIDEHVRVVHVGREELPRVHRSVEREAEWFAVHHVFAEDRHFHVRDLGLVVRAQVEEHLVAHTLGFALG